MLTFHLIRHGQTDYNAIRRIQGQAESQLDDVGRQQAQARRTALAPLEFYAVVSSSADRTRDTTQLLLEGRDPLPPVSYRDDLREIHLGDWQHRLWDEVIAEQPEPTRHFREQPHLFDLPGAETFFAIQQRGVAAIEDIISTVQADASGSTSQHILIVSHGAILQTILAHYHAVPMASLWQVPRLANCSHSIIEVEALERRVIQVGDVPVEESGW